MKRNICIVTDNVIFENLIAGLIRKRCENVSVKTTSTLKELEQDLRPTPYDLFLIDGSTKKLSVLELIQQLRTSYLVTSPIWFFPEIKTKAYLNQILLLGVNKIINRPYDPFEVCDQIAISFNLTKSSYDTGKE